MSDVVVERDRPGQPHRGKVFAAIHAHMDDVPFYAGGLCAKLIAEGYTGYFIRTSNDEMRGGGTNAENILSNEQDHFRVAKALGCKEVFDFYYRNHCMNDISAIDIRGRLIFLFRLLKVDTVLSFNPWGHYEENPDHWVTGRAVEEACWMAGVEANCHEHLEAGIQPHGITERWLFAARETQPWNRVVDVSSHIEKKIDAIVECKSQGGGNDGSKLRARLAKQGRRLPLLGDNDAAADRAYTREFLLDPWREAGKEHGVAYAERFWYVDHRVPAQRRVDEYVERNSVPL
jgi:LmbE family N-acetylglucosaminyl deacetylase